MSLSSLKNRLLSALRKQNRSERKRSAHRRRRSLLLEGLENRSLMATDLNFGDVAVVGYNTGGTPDQIALVVLRDLDQGTVFYVNDNEVSTAGGTTFTELNEMEASFTVKAGQTVTAGTVLVLPWGGAAVSTTTYDWSATTGAGLGNNNDEIYIYEAPNITSLTPTQFIYFAKIGTSASNVPSGLVQGETAISPTGTASRYRTTGATYTGTQTALLAAIGDTATNWEARTATDALIATDWTFTVGTGPTGPEVNVLGNAATIVDGDTTASPLDHTQFRTAVVGGSPTSRTYTIQNSGGATLTLGTFASSNPAFTLQAPLPTSVPAGGSATFTVNFAPTTTGLVSSTISFVNNDSNESPYDFVVSGLGATAASTSVAINELRMRDSVNDNVSNNFLEVYQTAGAGNNALSGLTLLAISSSFNPGLINFAVDLGTAVTDSNGYLLIADNGTTAVTGPGDIVLNDFDLFDSPATFLIVSGFTGNQGDDLDAAADGFDSTPWTAIIDSVSLDQGTGSTSFNYSPNVVVSADANPPAGVRRIPNGTGAYEILSFTSSALDSPGFSNTNANVILTQSNGTTVVTEGGSTDSFTLFLASEPTSNVTITVNTDTQSTAAPTTVTFTPTGGSNPWNVAQTVTITAVNDAANEGSHSSNISFGVASSDAAYNNFTIPGFTATVIDNDGVRFSQLLINEIILDPAGNDTGNELLEFRGTPGATIPADYYLVSIEGDGGLGLIDHVFSLGGMTIGANGFLTLLQAGNSYTTSPQSTTITATGTGWGTTFSSRTNDLENGSNSFLLIQSATPPTPNADVDSAGNGVLTDEAASWTVVDSIGLVVAADGTAYARTNYSPTGVGIVSAPNTIFDLTTFDTVGRDGYTPDYLARNGNTTGQLAVDWIAADIIVDGAAPNWTIESVEVAPLGVSGPLNHYGATNVFAGGFASPTVTSSPAGPIGASTPIIFTATIPGSPSTGTVSFFAGPGLTNPIGSPVNVVAGVATSASTTLPTGIRTVTAVYTSTAPNSTTTEGNLNVVVNATAAASVVGRQVYYNRAISPIFNDGAPNPTAAIDSTKSALLPGQTSTFANVVNYVRGINGLLIDVNGLVNASPSDFAFAVSNGVTPFTASSAGASVAVLAGQGIGGSSRVKIEFADNTFRNTWLRVTVLANANTGLASNDVFYFGSAVGEMNVGNLAGPPVVLRTNASDTANVRQNQSPNQNSVGVTSVQDMNKDGRVNATDTANVRQNQSPTGSITFFTAPAALEFAFGADDQLTGAPIENSEESNTSSSVLPSVGSVSRALTNEVGAMPTESAKSTSAKAYETGREASSKATDNRSSGSLVEAVDAFFRGLA